MLRSAHAWLLAVLLLAGCTPEPPFPFTDRSARFDIAVEPGASGPLCAGDLERFDDHADFVAEMLDVELSGRIRLYYYRDWPTEECGGGGALGCYKPEEDAVYASSFGWDHEVVHAVWERLARPDTELVFEEGLAEALSVRALGFPAVVELPSSEIGAGATGISRENAGHFMRWAIAEFGPGDFNALGRSSDARSQFFDWTGVALEDAEEMWLSESAYAYPALGGCGALEVETPRNASFSFDLTLDCDDEDTLSGATSAMASCRVVELDQGAYSISSSTGGGRIHRCVDEPETDPADRFEPQEVPADYHRPQVLGWVDTESKVVKTEAGRYVLCAGKQDHEAESAQIEVTWLGVVP